MALSSNADMVAPIMRSLIVNGTRVCLRPTTMACYNTSSALNNRTALGASHQSPILSVARPAVGASPLLANRMAVQSLHTTSIRRDIDSSAKLSPIEEIIEREIQDETAEPSDQFPGFSVETDGSDVKLTKRVASATVTVLFNVSSSLSEQVQEAENVTLVSMPDFQVQIDKNNKTLEVSCYFEETEDEEPGSMDPTFGIDELVLYEGDPKHTEFAASAEYFHEDLQAALLQYLGEHGIDDEFAKNLVEFATNYEKKQYISLMKRLKSFVSSNNL